MLPYKSNKELLEKIIALNFKPCVSKNIIRVGLVYLASTLISNPELCDLYIECLISIESDIREKVLNTDTTTKGNCVQGHYTQKYLLSGAPAI